jgi:hypothetical protein
MPTALGDMEYLNENNLTLFEILKMVLVKIILFCAMDCVARQMLSSVS